MLKAGADVHFRDPRITTERVLHHAVIDGSDEEGCWRATFTAGVPQVAVGQELLIYYEIKREFMQQPARIHALDASEEQTVVCFETLGDPISAESRQHYRVSTITAQIQAQIAEEEGCKVLDISSTGFAAVSRQSFAIGETVAAVIEFDDYHCEGRASVQSVRARPDGSFRYGFLSINGKDGGAFQEALNELSLEVQRIQLRRLSGAG